jgi:hypothetical protein
MGPAAPEGSGYACLLKQQMASWREAWSRVPDTTSPTAPFGIVQLADATDGEQVHAVLSPCIA